MELRKRRSEKALISEIIRASEEFESAFERTLNQDNRCVKLAKLLSQE